MVITVITDLLLTWKEETREMTGHKKKLRKQKCLNNVKRYSFPQSSEDTWNGLDEDVKAAV